MTSEIKEQQVLFSTAPEPSAKGSDGLNLGSARIEHADCIRFLRGLDTGSVDLIVTDPAYSGMNNKLQLGRGRIVGNYKDRESEGSRWFAEFEDTEENYKEFLAQCKRVLKDSGHIYIMFDSFSLLTLGPLLRDYFDVKNLITWDKVNLGMGHYFRRRHEQILFATNGNTRKILNRSFPDVWRIKRITRSAYPTQKPVELFDIMLSASAKEGHVICDPFAGSGSSAIAALKKGCDFVGSDVSEEAVRLATSRIHTFFTTGCDPLQEKSCVPEGERVFW